MWALTTVPGYDERICGASYCIVVVVECQTDHDIDCSHARTQYASRALPESSFLYELLDEVTRIYFYWTLSFIDLDPTE